MERSRKASPRFIYLVQLWVDTMFLCSSPVLRLGAGIDKKRRPGREAWFWASDKQRESAGKIGAGKGSHHCLSAVDVTNILWLLLRKFLWSRLCLIWVLWLSLGNHYQWWDRGKCYATLRVKCQLNAACWAANLASSSYASMLPDLKEI